jgi:hypothetical protein
MRDQRGEYQCDYCWEPMGCEPTLKTERNQFCSFDCCSAFETELNAVVDAKKE